MHSSEPRGPQRPNLPKAGRGLWRRLARLLEPSREHTAFSATVLLMSAIMLSRVIGYIREAYIAWAFGAGPHTDAYVAAFTIPDWLNYLAAGGTAAITFVSIFTRYTEEGREKEAQEAFSIVITIMSATLTAGIVAAEIFTPNLDRLLVPHFSADELRLCVLLTRILLPAQLFFYIGGVVSAVPMSRRLFLFPALGPLFYNLGIILGGVFLSRELGIASLAIGAVAGGFTGPFLINAMGARRVGMTYRPSWNVRQAAFREWLRLSIPLMLGVSLVTADDWILRYFASGLAGDITRLNYAKRLFGVPQAVLGQATGQASLPFFAKLFGERRMEEFAGSVNGAVYRVTAAALLASAWMMAAALPLVDLVYRRGHFGFGDSQQTAIFFFWFVLSLGLWAAQGLYARAFYAAGDTLTPMVAGTIVTLVSLPIYKEMFGHVSAPGLAMASDVGIALHTMVLAALLHRRNLVRLSAMRWGELGKALLTATAAAFAARYAGSKVMSAHSRVADAVSVVVVSIVWAGVVGIGLWITRSELPRDLRRRTQIKAAPVVAAAEETREFGKP